MDLVTDAFEAGANAIGWLTHMAKKELKKLPRMHVWNHCFLWSHVMNKGLNKEQTVRLILERCYDKSPPAGVVRRVISANVRGSQNIREALSAEISVLKSRLEGMQEGQAKKMEHCKYLLLALVRAAIKWPQAQSTVNRPRYSMLRKTVERISDKEINIASLLADTEELMVLCLKVPCLAAVVFLTMISQKVGNPDQLLEQLFVSLCYAADTCALSYDENLLDEGIDNWKKAMEKKDSDFAAASIAASETIRNAKSIHRIMLAVKKRAGQQGLKHLEEKFGKVATHTKELTDGKVSPEEYIALIVRSLNRTGDPAWATQIMLSTAHLMKDLCFATDEERDASDTE